MASTKQTARKSTGGKAPRKQLATLNLSIFERKIFLNRKFLNFSAGNFDFIV